MTKLSIAGVILSVFILCGQMAHSEIFKVTVKCEPTEQCEPFGKCDPVFSKTFNGILELPITKSEWVCENGPNRSSTLKARILPRLVFSDQEYISTPMRIHEGGTGVDCKTFEKHGFKYYNKTFLEFVNKIGHKMWLQLEPSANQERLSLLNIIASYTVRCSIEAQ